MKNKKNIVIKIGTTSIIKDKLLTNKYKITFDNVREAYPDITWGGRS